MSPFIGLLRSVWRYKAYTLLGILCHLITAILTVVSIPLVIPFFQILFGASPSDFPPPESWMDLEATLNYGFSRLIAMTDHFIALRLICIIVVVVFLLKNIFRFLISFFMVYVRNAMLRDLRADLWAGFENISLTDRKSYHQGHLLSLITNDLQAVDHGILMAFELVFKLPLVILGSLIIMFWLSPGMTLVAFGLILFTLLIVGRISHKLKSFGARSQDLWSDLVILTNEYLSALKLIRVHDAKGFFRKRFDSVNDELFKVSNRMYRRRDLASPLAEFLGVVTIVILLYFGSLEVLNDELMAGTFFAFIFAFYNVIDPAKSFAREYANVRRGLAALDRINQFRSSIGTLPISTDDQKSLTFKDSMRLKNISFWHFDSDDRGLNDISIRFAKGSITSIAGPSGVGKTTLLDLLLGFYVPASGEIGLDDTIVDSTSVASFRNLFGLVTQDPKLFHGSVLQNILLGEEYDQQKVREIISMTGLDESFLNKTVGDNNVGISGGEAQKVCLARVLYRSPEIIILDEPTSQLDQNAKREIIARIRALKSRYTVIIVSHQRELLEIADKIILMNNGSIVGEGQYLDLIERNEHFMSLFSTSDD